MKMRTTIKMVVRNPGEPEKIVEQEITDADALALLAKMFGVGESGVSVEMVPAAVGEN